MRWFSVSGTEGGGREDDRESDEMKKKKGSPNNGRFYDVVNKRIRLTEDYLIFQVLPS